MAVTVHQNFDSGCGVASAIDESTPGEVLITLAPVQSWGSNWTWFHVRIEGVAGLTVKVRFTTGSNRFSGNTAFHSWGWASTEGPDGDNWTRVTLDSFTTGQTDVTIPAGMTATNDTVWFAMHPAVSTARVTARMAEWGASPYVSTLPGYSSFICDETPGYTGYDSRAIPTLPMYGFRVTQGNMTNKIRVVWSGGNHPGETQGWRAFEAAVLWLLGPSAEAERMRRRCTIDVLPCINMPGLFGGYGRSGPKQSSQDHNRYWDDPAINQHDTVAAVKAIMLAVHGDAQVRAWFDWHGQMTAAENRPNELWASNFNIGVTRMMLNSMYVRSENDGYNFQPLDTVSSDGESFGAWINSNCASVDRIHGGTPEATASRQGTIPMWESMGRRLAESQQAVVAPFLGDPPATIVQRILAVAPTARVFLCDIGRTFVSGDTFDEVTNWNDQGPTGITTSQSSASNRPLVGNARDAVRLNEPTSLRQHTYFSTGANRRLDIGAELLPTGAKTIIFCGRKEGSNNTAIVCWRASSQTNLLYLTNDTSNVRVVYDQTASQDIIADTDSAFSNPQSYAVRSVRYAGGGAASTANYTFRKGGASRTITAPSSLAYSSTNTPFIGRRNSATTWNLLGGIMSIVAVPSALTDEQIEQIEAILVEHRDLPNRETYPPDPIDPGDDADAAPIALMQQLEIRADGRSVPPIHTRVSWPGGGSSWSIER